MNYIYDILLNFQKEFYEFYEWNNNDEIIHIRKIPFFYINSKDLHIIKNGTIQFTNEFCSKIYNKTERFQKIKVSLLSHAFLISDGKEVLAIKLNKNGIISHKSSLLLDEEEDLIRMTLDLEKTKLNYTILKTTKPCLLTRNEKENITLILNKLRFLYNHKEDDKLRFLYLECFEKQETNINKIFNKLQNEIKNNNKNTSKIIDFFKITSQK